MSKFFKTCKSPLKFELNSEFLPAIMTGFSPCQTVWVTRLNGLDLEIEDVMKHPKEIDNPKFIHGCASQRLEYYFVSKNASSFCRGHLSPFSRLCPGMAARASDALMKSAKPVSNPGNDLRVHDSNSVRETPDWRMIDFKVPILVHSHS